ncbi:unnamed protein product [Adineta steineri]|uniref:Uncharacterized protein n=1 Tax=Adineta steineri TaxID=433720 RepID=A0A814QBJ0_9BILA|nr:unnamed protein product [Adineta steineri]CAF1118327.1 unnamed protein product [Adineta steineri]CAF1173300.1 unnamed protein product [Adineta steineri]CAF1215518.1 unnamed protein product [Adineta steineri]CAF3504141.1 unnamed protein product [Adineta steineri]
MLWREYVTILILLLHVIKTGKLSGLGYVTQIITKILKNRKADKLKLKDSNIGLFDMAMINGTSFDIWMSQLERTKASINN